MGNKKILIAEASTEFSAALCDALGRRYDLQVCHSGLSVKKLLEMNWPDVLVMDLALPGIDGISLLKKIAQLAYRPRILVTTCFMSPYVESVMAGLGVDMIVLKPCNMEFLVERIEELSEDDEQQMMTRLQPCSTISSMLTELNLPCKRRGFTYLEKAIKMYMEQPARALTKSIYPEIASEHYGNGKAVERAIREVVHDSWENRDDKVWRTYFTPGREGVVPRPTNAEFISRLAERYKQAHEEWA